MSTAESYTNADLPEPSRQERYLQKVFRVVDESSTERHPVDSKQTATIDPAQPVLSHTIEQLRNEALISLEKRQHEIFDKLQKIEADQQNKLHLLELIKAKTMRIKVKIDELQEASRTIGPSFVAAPLSRANERLCQLSTYEQQLLNLTSKEALALAKEPLIDELTAVCNQIIRLRRGSAL